MHLHILDMDTALKSWNEVLRWTDPLIWSLSTEPSQELYSSASDCLCLVAPDVDLIVSVAADSASDSSTHVSAAYHSRPLDQDHQAQAHGREDAALLLRLRHHLKRLHDRSPSQKQPQLQQQQQQQHRLHQEQQPEAEHYALACTLDGEERSFCGSLLDSRPSATKDLDWVKCLLVQTPLTRASEGGDPMAKAKCQTRKQQQQSRDLDVCTGKPVKQSDSSPLGSQAFSLRTSARYSYPGTFQSYVQRSEESASTTGGHPSSQSMQHPMGSGGSSSSSGSYQRDRPDSNRPRRVGVHSTSTSSISQDSGSILSSRQRPLYEEKYSHAGTRSASTAVVAVAAATHAASAAAGAATTAAGTQTSGSAGATTNLNTNSTSVFPSSLSSPLSVQSETNTSSSSTTTAASIGKGKSSGVSPAGLGATTGSTQQSTTPRTASSAPAFSISVSPRETASSASSASSINPSSSSGQSPTSSSPSPSSSTISSNSAPGAVSTGSESSSIPLTRRLFPAMTSTYLTSATDVLHHGLVYSMDATTGFLYRTFSPTYRVCRLYTDSWSNGSQRRGLERIKNGFVRLDALTLVQNASLHMKGVWHQVVQAYQIKAKETAARERHKALQEARKIKTNNSNCSESSCSSSHQANESDKTVAGGGKDKGSKK